MSASAAETHRALVLNDPSKPLTLEQRPTAPSCPTGTALVRVLSAPVLSYSNEVFQNGNPRNYPYPKPLVPGPSSCVGRVSKVSPGSGGKLHLGDLVWVDATVTARDDPEAVVLQGLFDGFSDGSRRLMRDGLRDGNMAELVCAPLENVHRLDGRALLRSEDGQYETEDLAFLFWALVPYGGLRDVGLRAGETIIVSPATGPFGGVAVRVALAMGAGRVIAMGRSTEKLALLRENLGASRVETVRITGHLEGDAEALRKAAGGAGAADVFFDISPPQAQGSTHLGSAFRALRRGARVSLMGGLMGDVALPHAIIMHKDITIKGKWMYPQEAIPELVRMVEMGMLPIGRKAGIEAAKFRLEDWEAAFKAAEASTSTKYVVFEP